MVVANLFAACAIALTFDRLFQLSLQQPWVLFHRGAIVCLAALLALAAAEQINIGRPAHLSRTFEREHLVLVGKPPQSCRTFYAVHQRGRAPYEVQIDAMMIALAQRLPTINGYSGLRPRGWDFYDTRAANYEQRAQHWALPRHRIWPLPDRCHAGRMERGWIAIGFAVSSGCTRQIVFGLYLLPNVGSDQAKWQQPGVVNANWIGPSG